MRIVILNWKHPAQTDAGGAERYVHEIATRWTGMGHDVRLVVPTMPPRETRFQRTASNPAYTVVSAGDARTVFRAARELLRKWGNSIDHVIESVSTRPFCAHRVAGSRATALYHQMAADVWNQEYRPPMSWLGRYALEPRWVRRMRNARVVVVSPSTGADIARHGVPHVAVVPPGCDAPVRPAARPLAGGAPRFLWLGRMARTKRPDHALEAYRRIAALRPGSTLDMIGVGYMRPQLERNGAGGVTFHGFLPESAKHALLAQAHLMLMPGTREGWGITVMEAAGHGVPSVAYDVPGLRDAVVDGETGVLTAPEPVAMARAALSLLDDPARWERLSAAGAARAREYTWDRAATSLLQVIEAARAGEL